MSKSTDAKGQRMTPPSPSYMSKDQFAGYLADLRTNRTTRPGGARPLPTSSSRASTDRLSLDAASQAASLPAKGRAPSEAPSAAATSIFTRSSLGGRQGRDYYPKEPTPPLKPSQVVPTAKYMERGQRWMEKEEAVSLRQAMQDMDLGKAVKEGSSEDDESRLYIAALDEAAELVWQHQNGVRAPRPDGPYRYRPHLRRNSYAHARTASIGTQEGEIAPSGLGRDVGARPLSVSSAESNESSHLPGKPGQSSQPAVRSSRPFATVGAGRRRTSLKRNISGEVERPFSGDQIWEEPEASSSSSNSAFTRRASPDKPFSKPRSPFDRPRFQASRDASHLAKAISQVEIHRNPPTQSRNAQYTTNTPSPKDTPEPAVERKNGVEVRGDDIRAATSRRLKDRSSRLPEPTAVSDSPGRPIVSFDAKWEAPDEVADVKPDWPAHDAPPVLDGNKQCVGVPRISVEADTAPQPRTTSCPAIPSVVVAGPDDGPRMPVPSINVSSINVPSINVPSIDVPNINVPTIVTNDAAEDVTAPVIALPGAKSAARPLPSPGSASVQARRAQRPRGHWSPAPGSAGRATATCHECGLPIQGRLVALSGFPERFHPHCFSCLVCGTSLEAMEISPEPDHVRAERLERIRRRAAGEQLEELPGATASDDGDERLRFYCHLDWHELFAPRCKHCKTPILGEHIVALGEHWHYGHFFCAECGDPFRHGMTHIEKDGYAWCIKCQTKRTERRAPKCKMCKTAVIGQYIQALGGEWHEACFRCAECRGGFDDGQIFPKEVKGGMVVLCTACRTRELKS